MGSPVQSSCITQRAELEGCLCLPRWLSSQVSACQCRRHGFDPWVGKIPWRRKWQPTPVFLPGKCYGQGSLEGYSPRGCRVGRDWATKQQLCPQPLPGLKTGIHVGPFSWFLSTVILVGVATLMTVLGACGDQGGPCEVTPEVPWQQGCCSLVPVPCPSCHWEGNP